MKKILALFFLLFAVSFSMVLTNGFSYVVEEDEKTYIVDRQGERWDITQAVSIGFQPERFEFGLGRNAFTPLNDSSMSTVTESVPSILRVLGVSEGDDARAYSISGLTRHEIANSKIGSKPIAVGY